jgi:glycosyltransferase involved in cell wall biosynthesis
LTQPLLDTGASLRALIVMPVATQRGGSEIQLQQLVQHRREAGIEPTIAFLRPGPMVDWCREQGVRAVIIDAGRLRQVRRLAATVRALRELAAHQGADVVIGWMAKGQIYAGLAAATARRPSVWLQPGLPLGTAAMDRVATLLPARLVVTVSGNVDRAQRRLWPRRSTTVIYPAVDRARFDPRRIGAQHATRARLGLPADVPIFGSVGRLDRWKGFHHLLEVVPHVLERHPDAKLVLVGGPHELDPSYARELHDQAARLGTNGHVLLVGQQPNPEDWMQAMDIFVHTSQNEPFGMVVIEAMALGKPVVASAEGGPTEVITPGVDGLLSPFADRGALAEAILQFLDDDQLRGSVGRAAQRRAEDFTVERFARQFGAAISAAISPRSRDTQEAGTRIRQTDQLARDFVRRHAPGLVADRARRYQRRFRERYGVTEVARQFVGDGPAIVREGPFQGLRYPAHRLGDVDAPVAKLLGTYERELHPVIVSALNGGVTTFIDVGCADGYYAVGMPHSHHQMISYAFDLSRSARDLCREVARVNDEEPRMRIGKRFSSAALDSIDPTGAFVLCDIEGAERQLFDRDLVARLRRSTVVIEVHDQAPSSSLSHYLGALFEPSHAIERVDQQPRERVDNLPPVAFEEFRPPGLHWLVCRPGHPGAS